VIGERNRALTIIKSRGSKHSNQMRELIFSDNGITLADPYTAGGEVLMGTLRIEKEIAVGAGQARQGDKIEQGRRALDRLSRASATELEDGALRRDSVVRERDHKLVSRNANRAKPAIGKPRTMAKVPKK